MPCRNIADSLKATADGKWPLAKRLETADSGCVQPFGVSKGMAVENLAKPEVVK